MKNKILLGLIVLVFFLSSAYFSFIFEDNFRELIRYLYCTSTNNGISFSYPSKDIHFPSGEFVTSFGLFISLLFTLSIFQPKRKVVKNLILGVIITALYIGLYCIIDSQIKLIECTACEDGIRILNYNDIKYDSIFIISLVIGLFPTLFTGIKQYKNRKH